MLRGQRFVRLYDGVWRHRDHAHDSRGRPARRRAARSASRCPGSPAVDPPPARSAWTSGLVSRSASSSPVTITLALRGRVPAPDRTACRRSTTSAWRPLAAYVAYCAPGPGDRRDQGRRLAAPPRARRMGVSCASFCARTSGGATGPDEAHLGAAAGSTATRWSLRESEARSLLVFAGLPSPESRTSAPVARPTTSDPDRRPGLPAVGRGRRVRRRAPSGGPGAVRRRTSTATRPCAAMRVPYVQVTKERAQAPAATGHGGARRRLVAQGYDGPPPEFGERWRQLFSRLTVVVGSRRWNRVASA